MYLETHCNIGSKRAFPTGVLNRWHNCLLIYWRNVARLPRPHRFVYFWFMTQQDVHCDRQWLPKIWVDTFLVRSVHPSGKTELILTVKIEPRHPVEVPFSREFPAICNHCGVMTAWSRKTWKFCEQCLHFLKLSLSNCRYCAGRAQNLPSTAPHLAHIVPDFIQIGSLSAELLQNAWRPFLPRRVFTL